MKNPMNLALGATVVIVAGIAAAMMIPQPEQGQSAQTAQTQETAASQPATSEQAAVQGADVQTASNMDWHAYNNGIETAKAKDKLVMVQFFATWCGYCKKMDKEVFTDQKVVDNLKQHFVSVRVTESSENKVQFEGKDVTEKELTSLYQVSGFPTILFLDGEGKPLSDNKGRTLKIPGFVEADVMSGLLAYIGSKSYKDMDYDTYKEKFLKS